jgi:hypothetical protein
MEEHYVVEKSNDAAEEDEKTNMPQRTLKTFAGR